jgi:pyruvate-formate lyase-activating enzyme
MKKEDLQKSKSFCLMPWVHLATEPNGRCKICCLSNKHITDDNDKVFNLGYDDIGDIYNSKSIREVREKMLNGERISECAKCWREEDNGGLSQRQTLNQIALNEYPKIEDIINKSIENDYAVDHDPMYYDFRFGNLCNLKCRSCGSLNSSQILKEHKQINKAENYNIFGIDPELDDINDWYQTNKFKDNIYKNIKDVKKIYFTGGEPTLVEENYKLMERLISEGVAKNVHLTFNTNMTNIREDFYNLIQEFKNVEIAISIEGYGNIQEYLRHPSKWTQIEKNIRRMADMPKNIIMFACPVVQSVNLEYMVDFFKFTESINLAKGYYRIRMLPIVLTDPRKLSADILPLEYKKECFEKIKEFVESCENFKKDEHFMGRYNNIKAVCESDDYDKKQLLKFKYYTELLDKYRNENLKDVNPRLWEIVNNV